MKKISLLFLFSCVAISTYAQSYIGYFGDNYSGINSVISNPANIVDSRFKTDINLAGVSTIAGSDYFSVDLNDVDLDTDNFDESDLSTKNKNNIFGNADVLGPSFMFNITPKHAIALSTRARVFMNLNDINGRTYKNITDDFDENEDFSINEDNFYLAATAWAEFGLSYATILMDKQQHFLKGGLSLKYLQGIANAYAVGRNITLDYTADQVNSNNGSIKTTGTVTYGSSQDDDFDDFNVAWASGFAMDLGFVYEWRPDHEDYRLKDKDGQEFWDKSANKYKLKVGVSLTDLGRLNFNKGVAKSYDVNRTVNENTFNQQDEFRDALDNLYTQIAVESYAKSSLPTALHANVDWSINRMFYLNMNTDLAITSRDNDNTNRITNIATLTPRFEKKWFTFQIPLSVVQYSGFQAGAGLRAGPFYVGSGSVLSLLIADKAKAADVYVGFKVPIYQSKLKDKDGDGVMDKVDSCPEQAGPEENFGCPWPDTDGDTVLDKDDTCPDEFGTSENNGCPWPDTDGDTLLDKDDSCPEEAGPVENNGCPWFDTDSDGVLDKDDQCPDVVGTVANNGCPEVTEEVQKALNAYAKTILFNTGKASIKDESNTVLNDIIVILNEYTTAKFSIEGHTDSSGGNQLNQRLSDSRANAVKTYLVEKGVDQFRLSTVGYGEDRPIASNNTRAGRAQNRRVEINLVK